MLDNCEHLVDACAELVAAVLLVANRRRRCWRPAASRSACRARSPGGCRRCAARTSKRSCDVPALSQYDAVALFVDRARRARPSFAVSDDNAPAIAQICHRLDGIPLAIELAAARCRQMSAERIAAELDDRFRLLTGGARTVLPRQQTLAASVDWSYDLLDDDEQSRVPPAGRVRRAVPPRGGRGASSPRRVTSNLCEVFDLVSRLVDKSLVVADDGAGGEPRYRLLETLRAYAVDPARAADELTVLRDAHAAWWTDWLEPAIGMPTDQVLASSRGVPRQPRSGARLEHRPTPRARSSPCSAVWRRCGQSSVARRRCARRRPTARPTTTPSSTPMHGSTRSTSAATWSWARPRAPEWHALERLARARRGRNAATTTGSRSPVWHSPPTWQAATGTARAGRAARRQLLASGAMQSRSQREIAEDDPAAAKPLLADADALTRGERQPQAAETRCCSSKSARRATDGDLRSCIDLVAQLLQTRLGPTVDRLLHLVSSAALLARDEDALTRGGRRGERLERKPPATPMLADNARHRLELFEGRPSSVAPRDPAPATPIGR